MGTTNGQYLAKSGNKKIQTGGCSALLLNSFYIPIELRMIYIIKVLILGLICEIAIIFNLIYQIDSRYLIHRTLAMGHIY